MVTKPTSNTDWVESTPGNRTEPGAGLKNTGWQFKEKPPYQYFNWLVYNFDQWVKWLGQLFTTYVQVGSGADYATLKLAVAASKKKIVLVSDITVTEKQDFSLSNGVIDFKGFKIVCAGALADSVVLISGNENEIRNMTLECTHTAGSITKGLEITGARNRIEANIYQNGAGGTLATALAFSAAPTVADANIVTGVIEDKAGAITTSISDSGTDNDYQIIDKV